MNRRTMLTLSIAGAAGTMSAGRSAVASAPRRAADDSPELQAAVTAGVSYFDTRCDAQAADCRRLEAAIRTGDLAAAQQAYIEARPPYEEIETLAYAFEEVDGDIDARPYAFDGGETDENFRGFHRIEVLLFGYEDVEAALPYAVRLNQSVAELKTQLAERERFDAAGQFGGMLALTNEVAAKKISSEEEAWSNQSLLIFKHNWIGACSQYLPFDGLVARTDPAASRRVLEARDAALATLRPYFRTGVVAATPYTEVSFVERRRMADASNRLRDALGKAGRSLGVVTVDS